MSICDPLIRTSRRSRHQAGTTAIEALDRRSLGAGAEPPEVYADEAYRRLKVELVEDQEVLEGASYDRVRKCFRALVRVLRTPARQRSGRSWHGYRIAVCVTLLSTYFPGHTNHWLMKDWKESRNTSNSMADEVCSVLVLDCYGLNR